jgi:hypothetical protein
MSACASRCKFRASGVEGAGMAHSSVVAVMSFWLARGGVVGLSALMRSRACLSSSRARSPRADASPAMEARSSRTARYSSASLASSSRAWASCALTSTPLGGEGGGALGPAPWCGPVPGPGRTSPSLGRWRARRSTPARGRSSRRWSCRSSRTSSRGVEESLERHRVRHAGEVPLRVPVRSGGWQLAGGAVVRLVVGGGGEVPSRGGVATGTALACRHIGAGG